MSYSKVKNNASPQTNSNLTQQNRDNLSSLVHIFPINAFNPSISELKRQLYGRNINSLVYQRFNDFDAIVKKVEQGGKREICLIQLRQQQQDTCFPKNYVFPNTTNIFIVFFSFGHLKTKRPYFLATQQVVDFCQKQLKPQKIKLKSIQNLKSDKNNKNSSSHSTEKQKIGLTDHELISEVHSQEYQFLFYLLNEESKFHLNQNQFNYQYLLKSIQKIQKCQPFYSFQQLLRKQLYRQEKKYIILSNFSQKLEKILRQIKTQQLSCFHILIFGDMKPVNLFLDKYILLATSDFDLVFKFLKNNGFDSPELRQEQRRNSQRYSISSNDFRHKMDNLMNLTSQYTANSGFFSQSGMDKSVTKKKIRQWMVDKDNEESTKFSTLQIKTQDFEASGSAFKQFRSLDKSQIQNKQSSRIKRSYLSPKKKESAIQLKNSNSREAQTKQLDLYSKISNQSEIKQKNTSQIRRENKKSSKSPPEVAQKTQRKNEVSQKLSNFYFPDFVQQKKAPNTVHTHEPPRIVNNINIKINGIQNIPQESSQLSKSSKGQVAKTQRIGQQIKAASMVVHKTQLSGTNQQHSRVSNSQATDYGLPEGLKSAQKRIQIQIKPPQLELENQYYSNQAQNIVKSPSKSLQKMIKSKSLVKANQIPSPSKIYKGFGNKNSYLTNISNRKYSQQKSDMISDRNSLLRANRFAQKITKRSLLDKHSEIQQSRSVDMSQLTQKSKNKVSILAKKSQLSHLIFGQEHLQAEKVKLEHIEVKISRFIFIIVQELNYLNKILSNCFASPNDKILNYQNVQDLYQILRLQDSYDIGFIFCHKNSRSLINLKLLPRNYFIVIIQSEPDSYLQISEESKSIKLTGMRHFRLAQRIILQSKMLQYVVYRKSNKQAANLAKKFINSEFILQKTSSQFNQDMLDNYFCDSSSLTRLYLICGSQQLPQILNSLKEYSKQNPSFNSESCSIISITDKEKGKLNEQVQPFQVTFIDNSKRFMDHREVLKEVYRGRKNQQKEIKLQIFYVHRSISIQTELNNRFPSRFECIQYEGVEEVEKITRHQRQLEKQRKIYLLLPEKPSYSPKPDLFNKIFMISKTKFTDRLITKVFNVEELLELLRF